VSDSLVLRQFCRVYFETVPDQSTLNRWARLIQPATLHRLLDHIVQLAGQRDVTHGRKLRIDGTVVETTIHHPTDSTLLNDGVRVLSRTLTKAKPLLGAATGVVQELVQDRTQHARTTMKRIMEVARQKGEAAAEQLKTTYGDLVAVTTDVVARQAGAGGADGTGHGCRPAHRGNARALHPPGGTGHQPDDPSRGAGRAGARQRENRQPV
jgi:IS5 family transposase